MPLTEEQRKDAIAFVNNRRVIDGPVNDLYMITPLKHGWAKDIRDKMKANTWFTNEVDLSEDQKMFPTGALLEGERSSYVDALAFLSNLDGIQINNLTRNIGQYITSPEISMCIVRQAWEEALHVEAYSEMIETMPGLDPIEVYNRFQTDNVLADKNEAIMRASYLLRDEGYSPEAFVKAVVANIALEGIYFYSGFLTFYTLARMGKMKESAKMIKFIQRDEMSHLDLFVNIFETLKSERPELFTARMYSDIFDILRGAVELEIAWGKHIIRHGVMGLTDQIVTDFVRHLANRRTSAMGLTNLYTVENPVPWFDDFAAISTTEENFFEGKVSAYENGALEW